MTSVLFSILADANIGPDTTITLALAGTVCVFIIGVAVKINNNLRANSEKINTRFDHLESSLKNINHNMQETWSRKDQEIFTLRMQLMNPTLEVPDIQCVGQATALKKPK